MGECEAETHDCHADATCTNNSGSYECECNAGFTGDGKDCKDIDECKATENPCTEANKTKCNNSAGTYECSCDDGCEQKDDAKECTDIDECKETENPCKEANKTKCNNSAGTYECACDDGYEQKDDAKECTDIDECKATENPCKEANKTKCNNSPGKYECSCDDGFMESTNDDTKEDIPCIACSGPGAVESNGQCTCTDDENASLEGSACTCNALYGNKLGTCTLLPITNVEDIVCDSDAICQDFSTKCSEGKCACDISINAVAEAKDPAEEHSSGLKLTNACVIKTDCEIFEMKTPCGDNSNCVVGDDNEAGCECADGFEEDSTYAADRGDGAINGKCSRIDPCNPAVGDGYDCSAIIDSSCVTADDFSGACSCNENFLPYELDEDSEHKNYTKHHEKEYFENSADIECVHNSPCEETPCSSEEKKECTVLSVQSMPTAFCKCIAGYED